MKENGISLKQQLEAINSERKDLSDVSSLVGASTLHDLSNLSKSVLASAYLTEPTLSERLATQFESISTFNPHAELIKQMESLHPPVTSALENIQSFQSQHDELLAKATSVTSMLDDINFSSTNNWQNLHAPAVSEIEAAQFQYSEYLNSSVLSAVQTQHEEWLSKAASVTSILENINTSATKVWESIDQSISAVTGPLKALGFNSIQDNLALISNQKSTIEELSDQFHLEALGLNAENYLEQLLGNQNASILATLEFPNTTYAETIARANPVAEMFSPLENLVEKYSVIAESLAQIEISNLAKTDFDFATTETEDRWNVSSPLELAQEDEQKRFKEWFNDLPDLVKIFTYFVMLRLLEYMMGVLVNVTTPYWQEVLVGSEPETPKKQIIANANEHLSLVILTNHRFIDVNSVLHVRTDAGKKFEIIDTLGRGKIVKLVDKQKAWSLIEYYDPDSEKMIRGWVFSRYLHKLEQ